MECWQNERKGTLKVPFCEAIVILLTVLCLTINKIARCSLQAWEQSVIWERGLLRVWVFVWGVMPVKYCLVSCVPLPPLSSCVMSATLQIHFLCWLVTKENQIILKWVLSSTPGNYCQNWATLCWSVTSHVWGLCCGFLIPVPPRPPQVATSLQSVSRMTVPKCRGRGGRGHSNPQLTPPDLHLTICRE